MFTIKSVERSTAIVTLLLVSASTLVHADSGSVTVIEIDGSQINLSTRDTTINVGANQVSKESGNQAIKIDGDKVSLPGISIDGSTVKLGGLVINDDGVSVGGGDSQPVVEVTEDSVKVPGVEVDGDRVSVGSEIRVDANSVSIPGVTVDGDKVRVGDIQVDADGVTMPGIEVAGRQTALDDDKDYKSTRAKTRSSYEIVDSLHSDGLVDLTIHFAHDSDALKKRSYLQLDQIAEALTDESLQDQRIIIEGHTDNSGSDDYNLDLSIRRSMSVFRSLVLEYDFEQPKFVLRGFGERLPVASNDSKRGMKLNRRVTLSLVTQDP